MWILVPQFCKYWLHFLVLGSWLHTLSKYLSFFRKYLPNWLSRTLIQPKELPLLRLASQRGESPNQKLPLSKTVAATLIPSSGPHQLPSQLIIVIIVQGIVAATTIPGLLLSTPLPTTTTPPMRWLMTTWLWLQPPPPPWAGTPCRRCQPRRPRKVPPWKTLIPPPCLGPSHIFSPLGGVLLVMVVWSSTPFIIVVVVVITSRGNPIRSLSLSCRRQRALFSAIATPSELSPHPSGGARCCRSIGPHCAPQPCAAINRHHPWAALIDPLLPPRQWWQMTLCRCLSPPPPHMPSSLVPAWPLQGHQCCRSCWECHQHDSHVVHQWQVAECAAAAIATPITTAAATTVVVTIIVPVAVVLAAVTVTIVINAAIATTTATTTVYSTTTFNWLLFLPTAIAVAATTMTAVFSAATFNWLLFVPAAISVAATIL